MHPCMRWLCLLLVGLVASAPCVATAGGSETTQTLDAIRRIRGVIERHERSTGQRPENAPHLGLLCRLADAPVPVRGGVAVDAWGRGFRYHPESDQEPGYLLYSLGRNGVDEAGQGDDVGVADKMLLRKDVRAARQLFPMVILASLGPIVFGVIRQAKRAAAR